MPNFECNKIQCQICMEAKFAKHFYKSVQRNFNPLDFYSQDICYMKLTTTRDWKKYFIIFIDDCTRYIVFV